MSRPRWPASLPQYVMRPGYAEEPFWPRHSFQPEVGKALSRPAGTARMTRLECGIYLSAPQVILFEDFVWTDLSQGHLAFTGLRPRTQEQAVFTFLVEGSAPYKITPEKGVTFVASFTLLTNEDEG